MITLEPRVPGLTVVGDVMPARGVADSLRRVGPAKAADRLRRLLLGDVVVGNLECPLCDDLPAPPPKHDGAPSLRGSTAWAVWLRDAGFSVLGLANNHIMDYGRAGLEQTLRCLRRVGIQTLGAGVNLEEATRPLLLDAQGRRLALLAFGNGSPAGQNAPGVAPINSDILAACLAKVRGAADIVAVLLHAGMEFLEYPESQVRRFADEAVAGGANLVFGSHPHCLRGVVRGPAGIVAYSLGDFLMDTSDPQSLREHLVRTAVTQLGFHPSGAEHCREGLLAHFFFQGEEAQRYQLRCVLLGSDFLPRDDVTAKEEMRVLERTVELSEPLSDPGHPAMRELREIERAYRRAYYPHRSLRQWLHLPLRLGRRRLRQWLASPQRAGRTA